MKISENNQLIFVTSKVSDGNMALAKGEQGNVEENRQKFFKSLGISSEKVVVVSVVHGSIVVHIDSSDMDSKVEADGLITDKKGIYLTMLTADCLPIGLYDSKTNTIALIHASRHNIDTIITATINELQTDPSNLVAEIGPSIGPCHYQMDLWTKAEELLMQNGIKKENIHNQKLCTYESPDYYSHREFTEKNLSQDNRMITVFGIK